MSDKKNPKEASQQFHNIIKACVSPKATGRPKKKEANPTIIFKGYVPPTMKGLEFIQILLTHTDMSLRDAKEIKEKIEGGQEVKISVKNISVAYKAMTMALELFVK